MGGEHDELMKRRERRERRFVWAVVIWEGVLFWPVMFTVVFWLRDRAVIWPPYGDLFWWAGAVAAGWLVVALIWIPFLYWCRRGAE